jgi:hypothetical protein
MLLDLYQEASDGADGDRTMSGMKMTVLVKI